MPRAFDIKPENEEAIRAYLTSLVANQERLEKSLKYHVAIDQAVHSFESDGDLKKWIGDFLSQQGRNRLSNAVAVRKRSQGLINWRISTELYREVVAAANGQSPEAWLQTQLDTQRREAI